MQCPYCGKENVDMSPFCSQCGKSLAEMNSHPEAGTSPVAETNEAAADARASATQASAAGGSVPPSIPTTPQSVGTACPPPNPSQVQPQPKPSVMYAKSCMGAAWDDIIHTEGWVGKILLLGLIEIVPILNFVVSGYAIKWACQLPAGKIESMPKKIMEGTFVNGFYMFVLSLIAGIVTCVASSILEVVPIIGALAGIAVSFFMTIFCYLAYMRIGLSDRIGPGFDIPQIWNALKKDFGSLFCAVVVPQLIIGAIAVVLLLIVLFIFGMPAIGQLLGMLAHGDQSAYYGYGSMGYTPGVYSWIGLIAAFIPAFLIYYILACFLSAIEIVWVSRAVGHYVARNASEWTSLTVAHGNYYQV